jgi:CRISPR/Cas system-associated endoribonuclease Cas2
MTQIVEPEPLKWILEATNRRATFLIAAHFARALCFFTLWALYRPRRTAPSGAPISDPSCRFNLTIFTGRKDIVLQSAVREPFRPMAENSPRRLRKRNGSPFAGFRLAFRYAQNSVFQIHVLPAQGSNLLVPHSRIQRQNRDSVQWSPLTLLLSGSRSFLEESPLLSRF